MVISRENQAGFYRQLSKIIIMKQFIYPFFLDTTEVQCETWFILIIFRIGKFVNEIVIKLRKERKMAKEDLVEIYNRRAQKILKLKYKRVLGRKHREKLLQNASGKILEVAVGTGANFGFYPAGVELVAVDFSPVLLDMAKHAAAKNNLTAEFINSDVETLTFPENSFDTIVSTLSLCAYDNPVKLLGNFNYWCKPGGCILLFEHGLSTSNLLNRFLWKFDEWNYRKNGCHLNLDVVRTVEAAGINIKKVEVIMFGAHYLIWGMPGKTSVGA